MKLKNLTKETLPLAKEMLAGLVAEAKALNAQIKVVDATGADSPDGLTTKSGKKAGKKAAKKVAAKKVAAKKVEPAAEKPAAEKVGKKAGKKKAAKKVSAKKVESGDGELLTKALIEYDQNGKKISMDQKVLREIKAKFADGTTFGPKDVRLSMKLAKNYQVPVSQALKKHLDVKIITKVTRGTYQLA